jgi:hypothetical protein
MIEFHILRPRGMKLENSTMLNGIKAKLLMNFRLQVVDQF